MAEIHDYLNNKNREMSVLDAKIEAVRAILNDVSEQVEALASDSEANAEAITELAEILGGGE